MTQCLLVNTIICFLLGYHFHIYKWDIWMNDLKNTFQLNDSMHLWNTFTIICVYSTENSTQYSVIIYVGKELQRKWTYVCVCVCVCVCITESLLYSRNFHRIVNQLYFNKTKKIEIYKYIKEITREKVIQAWLLCQVTTENHFPCAL